MWMGLLFAVASVYSGCIELRNAKCVLSSDVAGYSYRGNVVLRSCMMFTVLANTIMPVLADGPYIYWGGGTGLIILIVVIVLLLRR